MAADGKNTFEVIVRGQSFTLTRGQIESEPGCLFEKALLGEFAEANAGKLVRDRHPATFALIVDHLSGYDVLPIDPTAAAQAQVDASRLLRYLQADADYYGLSRLTAAIQASKSISNNRTTQVERCVPQTHHENPRSLASIRPAIQKPMSDEVKMAVELLTDRLQRAPYEAVRTGSLQCTGIYTKFLTPLPRQEAFT